jgi:hypothetical protein
MKRKSKKSVKGHRLLAVPFFYSYFKALSRDALFLRCEEAAHRRPNSGHQSMSRIERSLRQLDLMGVLDQISGIIIGKPETYQKQGAPFGYHDLVTSARAG